MRELQTHFHTSNGVHKAVDGASFTVENGHTLGLVGESGSGKSLLCSTILGLQPKGAEVVGGEVLFEGQDLLKKSETDMHTIRGREIAMILEDPLVALDPAFNIGYQIGETIRMHRGVHGADLTKQIVASLRQVGVPDPEKRLGDYPHQFSPGMRQRIAAAVAIACRPKLLIADEPTNTLDATVQAQYLQLLAQLRRDLGLSIILVTHDFGIVATMCDRVAVMYAGDVVEQGSVREIFNNPAHPYTAALLKSVPSVDRKPAALETVAGQYDETVDDLPGCRFAPRCSYVIDRCLQRQPPEQYVGPGHFSACYRAEDILHERQAQAAAVEAGAEAAAAQAVPVSAPPETTERTPVLRVKAAGKTFQVQRGGLLTSHRVALRAVDGVSFDVLPGETFSLAGESGCGKSTLSHMILRLDRPTEGSIEWDGSDVWRLHGDELRGYRRSVQLVLQDPFSAMNPRQRVGPFVGEPLLMDRSLSAKEREARVNRALEQVGLSEWDAALLPRELSGGQLQRVAIARALACSPRLIVLDEPVAALDVSIRAQIMNLLKELQDSLGLAYLLIANHLGVVRFLSHHMAVMYLGRIVEIGPSEELFQKPLHPYTRALIDASLPATAGATLAESVKGETADLTHLQPGCRFAPRCPHAQAICHEQDPAPREFGPRRHAACHFAEDFA